MRPGENQKQRMLEDWRKVLATHEGTRLIANLLTATGWHGAPFGGADTHFTAYQAGRRMVGEFIVRQVAAAAPARLEALITQGLHPPEDGIPGTRDSGVGSRVEVH